MRHETAAASTTTTNLYFANKGSKQNDIYIGRLLSVISQFVKQFELILIKEIKGERERKEQSERNNNKIRFKVHIE